MSHFPHDSMLPPGEAMKNAPDVVERDGAPRVCSVDVAEHFGKNHRDVLRLIKRILKNLDELAAEPPISSQKGTRERNFALTFPPDHLRNFDGTFPPDHLRNFAQMVYKNIPTGTGAERRAQLERKARKEALASLAAGFTPTTVEAAIGSGAKRTFPAYWLTRDAFALLVMGFTGKPALEWKARYIAAFNAMEQELAQSRSNFAGGNAYLAGRMSVFAERWSPERRRLVAYVLMAREEGLTLTQIAARFGITHGSARHIVRRYYRLGVNGWDYRGPELERRLREREERDARVRKLIAEDKRKRPRQGSLLEVPSHE